jgi:hypothetical protein
MCDVQCKVRFLTVKSSVPLPATLQYCHTILQYWSADCSSKLQFLRVDNLSRGGAQMSDAKHLIGLFCTSSQSGFIYKVTCFRIILWTFEFCSWQFNAVAVRKNCNLFALLEQSAYQYCNIAWQYCNVARNGTSDLTVNDPIYLLVSKDHLHNATSRIRLTFWHMKTTADALTIPVHQFVTSLHICIQVYTSG